MTRVAMYMILVLVLIDRANADNFVSYLWATQEEDRQLSGLEDARKEGQLAALKCLAGVIGRHPDNMPARSLRANALMQMGRMGEASQDLNAIVQARPQYPALSEDWALYYHIEGDRLKELDELKKSVANRLANNPAKAGSSASVRWNLACIAELSGDVAAAKKEWRTWVDNAPAQLKASSMTHQVQFYLRQGDFENALAVARGADQLRRRQVRDGYGDVDILNWYAFSLWIGGKRPEALAAFFDAAQEPVDESLFSPGALFYRRSLATLSARVLAANGSERDQARAARLLDRLTESATNKSPYSLESAVMAIGGKSQVKPAVDTVTEVLKQAPNLDWALWAALYLGLSGENEAKPLMMLLPKDSIQKRIAEQEGKAPSRRGSNGDPG